MELYLSGLNLTTLPPEIGSLTLLQTLDLSENQLTLLPPEIGSLTALQVLLLYRNKLTTLPRTIGLLKALRILNLNVNEIVAVPAEIGQLIALNDLNLTINKLTTLPPEIGGLAALRRLGLNGNMFTSFPFEITLLAALEELDLSYNTAPPGVPRGITSLPRAISSLKALKKLELGGHRLNRLPSEIGSFTALEKLDLGINQLTTLPPEIGRLKKLKALDVTNNPLPPELLALSPDHGKLLIKFLHKLEDARATGGATVPRRFDEAKVLLLGAGDVGKTWLLRALQGQVPMHIGSTKGLEIVREPLDVPHPIDPERTLHLNCWDFGGQDYYQVTHQIFFSSKAIYLLVWKPRKGFDPELAARLERIRLSVGRTAKVLVVSTHADDNVPVLLGTDALKQQFGDLIWGFYTVDSAKGCEGAGITQLRKEIALAAAQLEGMDTEFPIEWTNARAAVLDTNKTTMKFNEFAKIVTENGVMKEHASVFADVMTVQGKAVYFAAAAGEKATGMAGDNLVVLDPEWLAKAIAFVIEDKPTIEATGFLDHQRLKAIWSEDKARTCPGYDPELHGYLLWLMWKFDIAYPLDDKSSLVTELITRNRPDDLRWNPGIKPNNGERQAVLLCRIPRDPPEGLIPVLSAAVHPLRRKRDPGGDRLDRNWKNGFFLDSALRGSAFVELPDRDIQIFVRDAYPANLIAGVVATLKEIVKARWPKLNEEIEYLVPCITPGCRGTHAKAWLEENRGGRVQCPVCRKRDLYADLMLYGFDVNREELMELLSELKEDQRSLLASAYAIFRTLDPENAIRRRAPSMFTIIPSKGVLFKDKVNVTCWCEHPDGPHPGAIIGSGNPPDYELRMPKEWLNKVGPYISWAAMLMKAFAPLAGDVVAEFLNGAGMKEAISVMNDAAKALPSGKLETGDRIEESGGIQSRPEIVALNHLHEFLLANIKEKDRWGDLRPIQTKSGDILWLCEKHAAIQQPPVQHI